MMTKTKDLGKSRKGRTINTTEHGSYDVSDIDEYVAQGNKVNQKQIMDYLVNEKGYSELKAWATYDVWYEDRFGSMEQRGGSRKGSEYDLIDNIISVAEREYGDLEDLTQTQADKVCETVAGITGESVENVKAQLREMDELNGVTRQGSRKGQDFTAQGINNVANAFKDITTKKIPNAIGKLKEERDGSRKGGTVTFKDVIDYFENLQETSPKDDDELWDEALNKFGVTTDLGKFDSSEFATYYYGSGTKSTNPIPDDMMVSGRNGSRKGTVPLCDLGSVSGKGSRPENLGSIASKVALGRKRSVNMDGEYTEQESRKGSRRGDALAQQIIGDNVEEDSDGYNFYDARNALRLEGYSEDEIEDNIDTWMYQHMN